ncbi:hypothetical protein EDD21DRAFT_400249 [Dissophora ornata]|nr:hypothetical protein EDD21DRAFT_400249 [Dissophora ornata]
MFKKPVASLKSFSPLRSSDRRRLRDEILASFPVLKDMEPINDIPINTIIAPDGLQSAKFTSYIDEPGTLYNDADGTPLWFKISSSKKNSMILPTVYTLWKFPNLIPALTTWNPVVDKLRNGADLMIPGVITANDTKVPDLEEGAPVAILARGNKYPLGVGTMAASGREITASRGSVPPKGKAVHILHVHQDQLWAMGSKLEFPEDWSEGPKVPLDDEYESSDDEDADEAKDLTKDLADVVISDSKGKAPVRDEELIHTDEGHENDVSDTKVEQPEGPAEEAIVLSTDEVDKYLQEALLQVLKFKITEATSKELLPLNASTLYSSYVLPNRAPGRAAEADIKKSSWKKMAKWLKAVEKQDLIKCKEIKGELVLHSVNWKHPQLVGFRGHKTVEQQAKRLAKIEAESSQVNSEAKILEVLEAYRPNNVSACLFEATGRSKDGYYTHHELRGVLTDYIKEKQLTDPKNQRMIRLDEVLTEALHKTGEPADRVQKDKASERLANNMVLHHFIGYRGQQPRFVRGAVKPVLITQEIRTGRKTVTKVSGLEHFFIDVDAFGQEMQVICAGSVASDLWKRLQAVLNIELILYPRLSSLVTPLVGASPKLNLREVMVQGPQLKNVTEALLEKGVPKKYIEFQDKTAKKK